MPMPMPPGTTVLPTPGVDENGYPVYLVTRSGHEPYWKNGPERVHQRNRVCLTCWCCPQLIMLTFDHGIVELFYCKQCRDGVRP
jgi:hypothetical protein